MLALNIIQHLSTRYNVICLILGGGDLTDHFRKASASLYEADRIHITDRELGGVIRDIASQHPLMFAIVNSIEFESGAESVESLKRPDRLANSRVLVLCAPPLGVSRRSHVLDRDGVLDQDDARRRSCGFPVLSGRVHPCGASGKMHRSRHSRHRLGSVGGESLADAKTASRGGEPQIPGDRPRQYRTEKRR